MGKNKKSAKATDVARLGPQKKLTKAEKKAEKAERERMRKIEIGEKLSSVMAEADHGSDGANSTPLRTFADVIKQKMPAPQENAEANKNPFAFLEQPSCSGKPPKKNKSTVWSKFDTTSEPDTETPPVSANPWNDGRLYSDVVAGAAKGQSMSPNKSPQSSPLKHDSATRLPVTLKIRNSKSDIALFPRLTDTLIGPLPGAKSASDTKICFIAADDGPVDEPVVRETPSIPHPDEVQTEDVTVLSSVDFPASLKKMSSKQKSKNRSPKKLNTENATPVMPQLPLVDLHLGPAPGTEQPAHNIASSSRPACSSKLSSNSPEFVPRAKIEVDEPITMQQQLLGTSRDHYIGQSIGGASLDKAVPMPQVKEIPSVMPFNMMVHSWNFYDLDTELGQFPKFEYQFNDDNYLNVEKRAQAGLELGLSMKQEDTKKEDDTKKQAKRMGLFGAIYSEDSYN